MASWSLSGGLEGGTYAGHARLAETATDRDGQFRFDSWGPVLVWGAMRNTEPTFLLFKSGYLFDVESNPPEHRPHAWQGSVNSILDGGRMRLKPAAADPKEHAGLVGRANQLVDFMTHAKAARCDWIRMPKLLAVLDREFVRLQKTGELDGRDMSALRVLVARDTELTRECGVSPAQLLGGIQ